jgi:hypothetical protein
MQKKKSFIFETSASATASIPQCLPQFQNCPSINTSEWRSEFGICLTPRIGNITENLRLFMEELTKKFSTCRNRDRLHQLFTIVYVCDTRAANGMCLVTLPWKRQ